jgi:uncharacterized protein YggE
MIAMRSINLILITAALSLSVPGLAQCQAAASVPVVPEVAVSASGSATRTPDHAELILEVATDRPTAADAAAINAEIQQRVLDTLKSIGYEDSAMTTTSFSVDQVPDYETTVPKAPPAYRARNAIRVRIADLSRIGSTIDAALAAGATHVEDVMLLSVEAEEARREALADASSKARLDAEALARSMGGHLGGLLSVSTGGMNISRVLSLQQGFISSSTPINTGDLTFTAEITARWRYLPGIR